jgi:hypothetical protein
MAGIFTRAHHAMINDLYEEPHTKKQSLRDGGNKKMAATLLFV